MKRIIVIAAFAALAGTTLTACHQRQAKAAGEPVDSVSASGSDDGQNSEVDDVPSSVANSLSNTLDDTKTALTATPTPQEFVDRAAQSDAFEIAAAKLAQSRSSSAAVRQFAAQMVTDHGKSTAKIAKAATQGDASLTPHPGLTADQDNRLKGIRDKSTKDFDHAYLSGQISAHRDALALMQRYADSGTNKALQNIAKELVPIIQHHLDMARTLEDQTR